MMTGGLREPGTAVETEADLMPNWAEQVTAVATAVSALGLISAIGGPDGI